MDRLPCKVNHLHPSSSCFTYGPSLHSKITLPDSNDSSLYYILRDVNPIVATILTQHHFFYDRAIIIVSSHSNLASQDNERLILRWVPMDGYHSPRLHRIKHPMALILQRLMKVVVHAQTGRCPLRNPLLKDILRADGFVRPILRLKQHRSALQALQAMPLAFSISTPPGTISMVSIGRIAHIQIATQPRVLLGLGRQLVQYLLIYNHSLSPHRQTQNLLFLHKHIGRNDSRRAKTCLSSTVPTIQLGRADGRTYYNRHLYKGSIFPWVKKVQIQYF